jgi:hypothetical protein
MTLGAGGPTAARFLLWWFLRARPYNAAMPDTTGTPLPALPRRVAWFAPWTWRPWKRWAIVGLLVIGYIESPVPLSVMQRRYLLSATRPPLMYRIAEQCVVVWLPIHWACDNSVAIRWFYETQTDALDAAIYEWE